MILRYSTLASPAAIGRYIQCTLDIRAMAGASASLLTKTQRNRIRDDFAALTDEKKYRDQQRIRKRVASGVFDFQLLTDYPDQQFESMFADRSDEELRAALADTTLVVERLRELHDIDRAVLIDDARARAETLADGTDTDSLTRTDLHTAAEVRRQTETEITAQLEPGHWEKRADRLVKLGAGAFLMIGLIVVFSWSVGDFRSPALAPLLQPLLLLLYGCLLGWVLIHAAQALKHDIIPAVRSLVKNPTEVVKETVVKIFKHPIETIKASWEEL
jgi:hypothetical protein